MLILALSMIHWHGPFETVVIDLFCTTVNVPLSVWYLSFYCNPRIQLAVVSKILMEGLLASATLYGEFMEKYVYSESPVENKINYKHAEKGFFVYDAGSIISVWGWQLTYSLMVPFIMFVEVLNDHL